MANKRWTNEFESVLVEMQSSDGVQPKLPMSAKERQSYTMTYFPEDIPDPVARDLLAPYQEDWLPLEWLDYALSPPLPVKVVPSSRVKHGSQCVRFILTEEAKQMFINNQPYHCELFGLPRSMGSLMNLWKMGEEDDQKDVDPNKEILRARKALDAIQGFVDEIVAGRMRFVYSKKRLFVIFTE